MLEDICKFLFLYLHQISECFLGGLGVGLFVSKLEALGSCWKVSEIHGGHIINISSIFFYKFIKVKKFKFFRKLEVFLVENFIEITQFLFNRKFVIF